MKWLISLAALLAPFQLVAVGVLSAVQDVCNDADDICLLYRGNRSLSSGRRSMMSLPWATRRSMEGKRASSFHAVSLAHSVKLTMTR